MSKVLRKGVVIKVGENLNDNSKKLFAYVTDKKGNVIEKVPISKGETKLKTKPEMFHGQAKVYITGDLGGDRSSKVDIKTLKKAKAYQPTMKISNDYFIDIAKIPDLNIPFLRRCHINGNLKKSFHLDGEDQVLPICDVRVHICEIDPWFIIFPQIPDIKIIDIREKLLDMILKEKFPHPPFPDPEPFPYPVPRLAKKMGIPRFNKDILKKADPEMMMYSLPIVSDEIVSGLASQNIQTVRHTLLAHYKFLYPYFCWWPRRWPLYHCDHIATVFPDCDGRFEYDYAYFPTSDHPDIFIWIEANIDGSWETVYRPWKPCGTHWNYESGTEINIMLTDPRLKPCVCNHLPGEVVWIKKVNSQGIDIRNIQQNNNQLGHITNGIGLTNTSEYNACPFAKSFPLVVQFGSGFPGTSVKYYRWKYKRVMNANLNSVTESFSKYDNLINKYYTYEEVNSQGDTVFSTDAFKLGPVFIPNKDPMYKIPHVDAADDVGITTARWNQNTYGINLNTESMNDGLYEFVFELVNSSGNVVAMDPDVFVVTKKSGETTNPPDADTLSANGLPEHYLIKNSAGKAIGFKFYMRIDNNVCQTFIQDAMVDGTPTHSECGFAQYANKLTSQVTLKFEAIHPHNFAHYHFWAVRGNGNSIEEPGTNPVKNITEVSDYVTQTNHGYIVSGNMYSKNITANTMLGPCDQAAFAESLFLRATHTNGNRRIYEYDSYDSAGFAIEPATL